MVLLLFLSSFSSDIPLAMTAKSGPTYSCWTTTQSCISLGTSWSFWIWKPRNSCTCEVLVVQELVSLGYAFSNLEKKNTIFFDWLFCGPAREVPTPRAALWGHVRCTAVFIPMHSRFSDSNHSVHWQYLWAILQCYLCNIIFPFFR